MLKSEFVNVIQKKMDGKTKKEISEFIDAFVDCLADVLAKGNEVKIVNFGTFRMRKIAAHKGVDPVTKKPIDVNDVFVPMFKVSKTFKSNIIG